MTVNIKDVIMKPIADNVETLTGRPVLYTHKGKPKARPDMPYFSVEIISVDATNPNLAEESDIDIATEGDYSIYMHQTITARIQGYGENVMGYLKEFELMQGTFDWSPLTINRITSVRGNSAILNTTNEERAFLNMEMSTIFTAVVNSGYFNKMEGTVNLIRSGMDDTNVFKSASLEAE